MSKTEENLKAAFAGESQARNKYTFFAEKARQEGYHYIAKIFEESAENEKNGNTEANLKEAIGGEHYETVEMYPTFAKEAEEEGNKEAAIVFKQIGKIEQHHRDRYKRVLEMVQKGEVFKRKQPIKWKCSICGYVHEGTGPPPKCPSCKNPREYYEPANMDL
jgi:rubrerythrin